MRITKVYTRTGDDGTTGLAGGRRVRKDDPRIEAYGAVDELNSLIGWAIAEAPHPLLAQELRAIQQDLFDLGADLCVLEEERDRFGGVHLTERRVERLERTIDRLQGDLEPLREFILPAGARTAAALHVARAAARRAERRAVALAAKETIPQVALRYLNRLSDLLFVMARWENRMRGVREASWEKSRDRPRA